jgi:hypothetical protein
MIDLLGKHSGEWSMSILKKSILIAPLIVIMLATIFLPVASVADNLGSKWTITEGGYADWNGTWQRRGDSNIFDVTETNKGASLTVTFTGTVTDQNDSHVTISRTNSSDGNNCTYTGDINGNSIKGQYRCDNGGPYNWSGVIVE